MAKPRSHGKTFFLLGLFALAALIVIGSFISDLFSNTFPGAARTSDTSKETIVSAEEMDHDPLVTVVPRDPNATPAQIDTDPWRGAKDAAVTIVEFGDFQCTDCADAALVISDILDAYPNDVKHVWKDYPLSGLHPQAMAAAEAARCAQEQKGFWQYHDLLLLSQLQFNTEPWAELAAELEMDEGAFESCMLEGSTTGLVTQGYLVARSLDVTGTPTFYINDQVLSGAITFDEIKRVVDEELENN